jgi:hypothetical protein
MSQQFIIWQEQLNIQKTTPQHKVNGKFYKTNNQLEN